MENIVYPTPDFDFSKLALAHPTALNNGAYFTKILYNNDPLYIQTLKSKTKQGVIKTGKKFYCDVVFDNNSEQTITWFEKLEEKCQQLLFDKNIDWFEGTLDKNDIDNAFNSILKVYKSGKCYLLKTNIKTTPSGELPSVKVYNENETVISYESVNADTEIISILEIQGIKFTTRSFQVDICLKQIMILDTDPLFENCIIKPSTKLKTKLEIDKSLEENQIPTVNLVEINNNNDHIDLPDPDNTAVDKLLTVENNKYIDTENEILSNLHLDIEELPNNTNEYEVNLTELDIGSTINNEEPLKLTQPTNVYLNLYRDARNKAKTAKKNAILAYLEAKNIKKTFMIENLVDDESDFDDEIDEVSESELDNL